MFYLVDCHTGECCYQLVLSMQLILEAAQLTNKYITTINDLNLSLEFPAVTICNVNAFSAEKLRSNGIDIQNIREI